MYSKTVIVGNLARDPDSKKVGDSTLTKLVVAVSDPYQKDKTSYIDVDTWGKTADNCKKYLQKGRQILAEGRLVQDIWEKDGKKNSKLFVKADNVQFMGKAKQSTSSDSAESSADSTEDIPF